MGSYTYKLFGKRYMRMYKATNPTVAYAADNDAKTVADVICTMDWKRSSTDDPATLPAHSGASDDSDEANVKMRDYFDACCFCAEHNTKSKRHRVYANTACYVFKLPSGAAGLELNSLQVRVSSDPYNQYGARVAVLVDPTATDAKRHMPETCEAVHRGGVWNNSEGTFTIDTAAPGDPDENGTVVGTMSAKGVAPRRTGTNSKGSTVWYSNARDLTFDLTSRSAAVVLGSYLYVTVQLEKYFERNNYLEGASCLGATVTIDVNRQIGSYEDGATIDCRTDYSSELTVCSDGVLPDITGDTTGIVAVNAWISGSEPRLNDDRTLAAPAQTEGEGLSITSADKSTRPKSANTGLSVIYGKFLAGLATAAPASEIRTSAASGLNKLPSYTRPGVGFSVRCFSGQTKASTPVDETYKGGLLMLTSSVFMLPVAMPSKFQTRKIDFTWTNTGHVEELGDESLTLRFWLLRGEYLTDYPTENLKNPALYTGSETSLEYVANATTGTYDTADIDSGTSGTETVPDQADGTSYATEKADGDAASEEAEGEEAKSWELLGEATVDKSLASQTVSFDCEGIDDQVVTILVSAYLPLEGACKVAESKKVETAGVSVQDDFDAGLGKLSYDYVWPLDLFECDDASEDSRPVFNISTSVVPTITFHG